MNVYIMITCSKWGINRVWSPTLLLFRFPCPRSRLRIKSRETGSAVPSRFSPIILHTQAESGVYSRVPLLPPAFRDGVYLDTAKPPTGQSRVNRVTQLRTHGVHRQESTGIGPVVFKVVPVTSAAFLGIAMNRFLRVSLIPHPLGM